MAGGVELLLDLQGPRPDGFLLAGRYTLRLRMIDDQFHPSATLTASFDAQ